MMAGWLDGWTELDVAGQRFSSTVLLLLAAALP